MGNPLSPIVADLVMEDLLEDALQAIGLPVPVTKKYVDDLFLSLPRDKVEWVHTIFNSQHKNIQFTVELELNNRLPFLDMVLIRDDDQTISTEWYIKPIASGRFLNFHSFHPMHTKMNVAFNFAKRVSVFSSAANSTATKHTIKSYLLINDYPKSLISRVINRVQEKPLVDTAMEASEREEQQKIFRSLTNIDGITQQIIKTFSKDYPRVKIATKHEKTVGSILPLAKDKTPTEERSNVIYKIQCDDCDSCYIGMTTGKLKTRVSGHRSNIKKLHTLQEAGYTNADTAITSIREKTALVDHAAAMGHAFRLEATKIVDRTNKATNLPILESCHIMCSENTVNKRTDTDNLNAAYAEILHSVNNNRKIGSKNKK